MSNILYRVSASRRGVITETEPTFHLPSASADAHRMAQTHTAVVILRARTDGINAGKFFLYQIIK